MAHCQGCDSDQPDVRDYIAHFESTGWERVEYCGECYDLAKMNWNGETTAIAPTSGDRTGEDFNARARRTAEALGILC